MSGKAAQAEILGIITLTSRLDGFASHDLPSLILVKVPYLCYHSTGHSNCAQTTRVGDASLKYAVIRIVDSIIGSSAISSHFDRNAATLSTTTDATVHGYHSFWSIPQEISLSL
jgi:hypothetical protein